MKEWLIRFIEKHFKVWGVFLEADLPPEFLITKHAADRLWNRVGVKADKHSKVTVKAWHSKVVTRPIINRLEYAKGFDDRRYTCHYRELMGWVFVFGIRIDRRGPFAQQKVLITVYK
jgi:hypothetical protein